LNPFDSLFRWGPLDREKPPWPRARDGIGFLFPTPGVRNNTLHYGANCPRAYPRAIDEEWPFTYADLVPYYEQVEATLPVTVPDVLAEKDRLLVAGCERTGLDHLTGPDVTAAGWRVQPNAILPVAEHAEPLRYPASDGCVQCGECIVGCRNIEGAPLERHAKRGTNVSYAPLALRTGNCEFRTGVFATRIVVEESNGTRVARAIRYRDQAGAQYEIDARALVLCAGAIETPRLWLSSGLPDNGHVGRHLTTHWFDYVSGVFPTDVNMFEGQTSMVRAEFPGEGFIESQGLGPMLYALSTSLGPARADSGQPWRTSGRRWGGALKRAMENYRRTAMLVVCVDDDPLPRSRVVLAEGIADENNPAPLVRYRASDRTVRLRDSLARRAAEMLVAAGADPDLIHRADAPASSVHIHGTMRMGSDPSTSVVDAGGEAHGIERLFIADTSVFANGIGGPNPTLTAQAVATKIADGIAARYFS
ncbi:MAG: GMC family oxidoreductase, partial [Actinobacteria bacterium]|nr:GMC family oxidoreductase [Actinomycetota bacterium]